MGRIAGRRPDGFSCRVARAFGFGPGQGFLDEKVRQCKGRNQHDETKDQQALPGTKSRGHVAGDDAGNGHAHIAGKFVEADGQATLVGACDVKLGSLRHGPGQSLVYAEQHGRGHNPAPARCIQDHEGDRYGAQPAEQQYLLAPDLFGQAPGHEIERSLDEAEGHNKGDKQHERALGHTELVAGQGRHDSAHHAQRQADQQHLEQLVNKLGLVVAYAMNEIHASGRDVRRDDPVHVGRTGRDLAGQGCDELVA